MNQSGARGVMDERWDVFISHSSANAGTAERIERGLKTAGLKVWLDDSEIRLGVLLANELQESIRASRTFLLLWSKPASQSRWVVSEILTAYHLDRFIIPGVLDDAEQVFFLSQSVFLDLRVFDDPAVDRLARAVRKAPDRANELPVRMSSQSPQVREIVGTIAKGQKIVTDLMGKREIDEAGKAHNNLDEFMQKVLASTVRHELDIVNLAGFHWKNAYLIKHWDAIQAGRSPKRSPLLDQAERFFFETLLVDPNAYSALNGVGSVLMLEGDLDAAEFFIRRAIHHAKNNGIDYSAAKHDLQTILHHNEKQRR